MAERPAAVVGNTAVALAEPVAEMDNFGSMVASYSPDRREESEEIRFSRLFR
jgi:hypothetical protein